MKIVIWILYAFTLMILSKTKSERINSLASDLAPLFETQRFVINDLTSIIERRKESLHFITKKLENYTEDYQIAKQELRDRFKNPVKKLLFILKLITGLNVLNNILHDNKEWKRHESLKYPTYEDLEEAVSMISNVQKFYQLNVSQLAGGILNTSYSLPMLSSDCYEIGKVIYKSNTTGNSKYNRSLQWFVQAYRLYDTESYNLFEKYDIVRHICNGYDKIGDHSKYVQWAKKLIEINPINRTEIEIKMYMHEMEIRKKKWTKQNQSQKVKKKKIIIDPSHCLKDLDRKTYRMICRGEVAIAPDVSKRLKCWYFFGYNAFTRLAPFKAEQLYIKPHVFLFHDIVSDSEINELKRITLPRLLPSISVDAPTPMTSMVHVNSKSVSLNASQSRVISQRISDFSGYSTSSSTLFVTNYGVGGHYLEHVDGPDTEKLEDMLEFFEDMQRVSTVTIYLSEVEQGGATVFPVLGLSVFPVKGSALYWTNLLPSEDLDYTTCHGACPVLRGSRLTAAQFIRNEGQELKRPCTKKVISKPIKDIPYPVLK